MSSDVAGQAELGRFIADLRDLREQAGQPSLRAMARTAHYSHTALSGVLSGSHLPSLALTLAFVRACQGDEQEWRRRWNQLRVSGEPPSRDAGGPPPDRRRRRRRWLAAIAFAMVAASVTVGVIAASTSATTARSANVTTAGHSSLVPTIALPRARCPGHHFPGYRPLITCDDSVFIADVTIPDGTTVRAGQTFEKIWEIQNTGLVPWRGRYLTRQGLLAGSGLCGSLPRVPVPTTLPGQDARISVTFTAPSLPGSCRVDWKMADENGRLYFPDRAGLYILVNVTG